ncbi:hypothetical protein BH23VER1_BH23VER1_03550 [soil metagenome]
MLRRLAALPLLWTLGQAALAEVIEVAPASLTIHEIQQPHGLLVTAVADDGTRRDVTGEATFSAPAGGAIAVVPHGQVSAHQDGDAEVIVTVPGLGEARVAVTAQGIGDPRPVSFARDVVPVLTRYDCNSGGCHGKGTGQNTFRLSLRGYAPELDHPWITQEVRARRIDPGLPPASLLLQKPTGEIPHEGGVKFDPGSRPYQVLAEWIAARAPAPQDDDAAGAPTALEILPGTRATLTVGQIQRLLVRARYPDGRTRDVTWLTQFFSNDESVAAVDEGGTVTSLRPGETSVRAHFEGLVHTVAITTPYPAEVDPEAYAARQNFIDDHVFAKLHALRIPPSPPSDDATFIRRASLDATGTLPTPGDIRAFLADPDPNKRAKLVDSLLASPEFAAFWTLQLADLLQNRVERDHDVRGSKGVRAFQAWLHDEVAANTPWDKLARKVLTATGDSVTNPAVGYFITTIGEHREVEKSEVTDSVAQAFLGTRIGCARCHNHPLEKFTQDDFYHLSAYFARVSLDRNDPKKAPTELRLVSREYAEREKRIKDQEEKNLPELQTELAAAEGDAKSAAEEKLAKLREEIERGRAELPEIAARPPVVRQLRTGEMLPPQPLDRSEVAVEPGDDVREALVDWMTGDGRPLFSGAMVNRIWRHYLGVGLVENVDDLRDSNPPSNPALWDALRNEFVTHGYDLRHLMRQILNSRTYALSSTTLPGNETESRFYSRYYTRRLPAEVLQDAISQATGVPDHFAGYPVGTRATQLAGSATDSYFLGLFGRPDRVTACACERSGEVTLPQLLHLQNAGEIRDKIRAGHGRLHTLARSGRPTPEILDDLFLATVAREPDADQRATVHALVGTGPDIDPTPVLEDLLWALLNSKEFAFNH